MGSTEEVPPYPAIAPDGYPDIHSGDQHNLLDEKDCSKKFKHIITPTRCKGCTVIVEPMLFLFMLSQFPLFILLPQYVQRREWAKLMGNMSYPDNTTSCNPHNSSDVIDPIQGNLSLATSQGSLFGLQSDLISALPAIVSVLFLGPYSDIAGRRYAFILPIIGQTIFSFIVLLDVYFTLPLELIFVGSFIYGCCGFWVTLFMAAISYISDITSVEKRSFRIVMAELCVFAPTILSSAGSGFWALTLGFSVVFFIVFIFNIIILLYAIFFIPETIQRDPNAKFFSLDHVKKAAKVLSVNDHTNRRWKLLTLLFAMLLYLSMSMGGIDTYFMMGLPLCWSTVTIGIFSAIAIAVAVIGSAVSSKILSLFLSDVWIVVIALAFNTSGNFYKFFVVSTQMMFGSAAFAIMGVVATPIIRAMMSKLVDPTEIGSVFSGVAVVEVICGVAGELLLTPIYVTTSQAGHPSTAFVISGGVYAAALLIILLYAIFTGKEDKNVPVEPREVNA